MSKESLQKALQGSHTVFLVTNYWETPGSTDEVTQGKNIADVAKDVGVQHPSSHLSCTSLKRRMGVLLTCLILMAKLISNSTLGTVVRPQPSTCQGTS